MTSCTNQAAMSDSENSLTTVTRCSVGGQSTPVSSKEERENKIELGL